MCSGVGSQVYTTVNSVMGMGVTGPWLSRKGMVHGCLGQGGRGCEHAVHWGRVTSTWWGDHGHALQQ